MLKQRLAKNLATIGSFIKTPHYHNVEVICRSDLDLVCLDAEHAIFERGDLDACVLAANANRTSCIVRPENSDPSTLLNALDIGANGVLVPHVKTHHQLQDIIDACYYHRKRGYAGSTRAAGYTTHSIADNLALNQSSTCVIPQIEDLEALDNLHNIAKVKNVDAFFIGTMDLTLALGEQSAQAPKVTETVEMIVKTLVDKQQTVGMFVPNTDAVKYWLNKGVRLFLLSSDQQFILSGAKTLTQTFRQISQDSQ